MTRREKAEKSIIPALLLLLSTVWFPALSAEPGRAVERFVRECGISPGKVAVKIIDLGGDSVMAGHNTSASLIPASIMKSVTTAALLGECGIDYRYHTGVGIDGPVDMGIVRGNLVVEGACDPSLNSREEPVGRDIVAGIVGALKTMGINRIEGEIVVDESRFAGPARPESWMSGDFAKAYGTGSHALNFEDNAARGRSVENPQRVFQHRLQSALGKAGILLDGKDLGRGTVRKIYDHVSPPVDEIMRSCMMRSDNLFAESMLRTYGVLTGGDGSTAEAAEREMEKWRSEGMPLDGVVIVDGSGLSRSNRVTADFMGSLLRKMSDNPDYASFFPLAGQEGTLKRFLADTPLDGYIAMKTGSMKGIQCYAGYKLDENYVPTHVAVIIMNEIKGSRERARKAAERMLLDIFDNETNIEEDDEQRETEQSA